MSLCLERKFLLVSYLRPICALRKRKYDETQILPTGKKTRPCKGIADSAAQKLKGDDSQHALNRI
jgi:hypothetical protein